MMFSMSAVAALLAALLFAPDAALGQVPENCTAADITARTHFCQDCRTGVTCITEGAAGPDTLEVYVTCTKPGEACELVASTSTCVPLAQSHCSCAKPQQCDAYDDGALLVCLNGDLSTIIISQCPPATPTCSDDVCTNGTAPGNPCDGIDGNVFVPIRPECTSGAFCMGGTSQGTVDCLAGQFFDPAIGNCATLPPPHCEKGCTGSCPDKMNCSRYYVCDSSGVGISQDCTDPARPFFDTLGRGCQDNELLCLTHGCVFDVTPSNTTTTTTPAGGGTGSTTTPATTTTNGGVTTKPTDCNESNVYERYPHEENCKMYWLCALVSPGKYEYIEKTCPADYVFNPTTTYCDYPENVPDCVVPTTAAP